MFDNQLCCGIRRSLAFARDARCIARGRRERCIPSIHCSPYLASICFIVRSRPNLSRAIDHHFLLASLSEIPAQQAPTMWINCSFDKLLYNCRSHDSLMPNMTSQELHFHPSPRFDRLLSLVTCDINHFNGMQDPEPLDFNGGGREILYHSIFVSSNRFNFIP